MHARICSVHVCPELFCINMHEYILALCIYVAEYVKVTLGQPVGLCENVTRSVVDLVTVVL